MDAVLSLRPSAVVIGCRENHKLGLSDQKTNVVVFRQ